jgi:ParB-like chromosome segregation protein Spo0J
MGPVIASAREQRSVSALIPYAKNARTHSPTQVSQIVASIVEFGFTNPILIDPEGGIIAGHGRVTAAEERARALGIKSRRPRIAWACLRRPTK